MNSARNWLQGTFLHVRLKKNPDYYNLEDGTSNELSLDARLEHIASAGIDSLEEHELVENSSKLRCSDFGDAMARYCVQFETMKHILGLPPKAKISEIVCERFHSESLLLY